MKTLADIRSGVSKKAKGEEQRHINKVRETEEGKKVLITDHEIEVAKKTNRLKVVAETKRNEVNALDGEYQKKREEALASLDTLVEEAKTQATEILAEANHELEKSKSLQTQVENQQEVLNVREQKLNTQKENQNRTEQQLEARTAKIASQEEDLKKKKSAVVKADKQSRELVETLLSVVQAGIAQIQALGRLSDGASLDLSGIVDKISTIEKTYAVREQKIDAKEEHLNKREEQLDKKHAIIKEQRKQLRMAKKDPSLNPPK